MRTQRLIRLQGPAQANFITELGCELQLPDSGSGTLPGLTLTPQLELCLGPGVVETEGKRVKK